MKRRQFQQLAPTTTEGFTRLQVNIVNLFIHHKHNHITTTTTSVATSAFVIRCHVRVTIRAVAMERTMSRQVTPFPILICLKDLTGKLCCWGVTMGGEGSRQIQIDG